MGCYGSTTVVHGYGSVAAEVAALLVLLLNEIVSSGASAAIRAMPTWANFTNSIVKGAASAQALC